MHHKIGFIGLGLIGGSLAKAIREKTEINVLVAYDQDEQNLLKAKKDGILNHYSLEINSLFSDCDIIFLCAPIEINIKAIHQLQPIISENCILTDVGSTKQKIMNYVMSLENVPHFIGGHPMTGSERSGYGASDSHLFENAYYLLTPVEGITKSMIQTLYTIISNIGALPLLLDYIEHDAITAVISHVPHVVASTLVHLVQDLDTKEHYMHQLAAGGFKDLTRVASSSPTIWQHICISNREEIIKGIQAFISRLMAIQQAIEANDKENIYNFFAESKAYRNSFSDKVIGSISKPYKLTIDVIDKPGIIAEIATLLSQHTINIKNIGIMNNREQEEGVLEIVFYDRDSQQKSIELLNQMHYRVFIR